MFFFLTILSIEKIADFAHREKDLERVHIKIASNNMAHMITPV